MKIKRTPIIEADYVVVDTELTGLDEKKDSIVSIAAIKMIGGRISLEDKFYRLVNPETELKKESVLIHGITHSEVSKKPGIKKVLSEFSEFCSDNIIVGHFLAIDMSFINRDMKKFFGTTIKNPGIDTYLLYRCLRKKFPEQKCLADLLKDSGLYKIAKCFDIQITDMHNAIKDAFITAQIFQRFMPLLRESEIETTDVLLKIGDYSKGADKYSQSEESCNF
ncbi:MAG: 3'-5' exonuclease [Nitrospiraceae bacterium]|nr:3'-5' exonuclease [Nitrospiraceae bacterium]